MQGQIFFFQGKNLEPLPNPLTATTKSLRDLR